MKEIIAELAVLEEQEEFEYSSGVIYRLANEILDTLDEEDTK